MSTMTEKERREAERRKRIRAASREFEKKLGLTGDQRADDCGDWSDWDLTDTQLARERGYEGDV